MSAEHCFHCRGAEYVLPYWLDEFLNLRGVHMTDLPREAFKKIPVEMLYFCHCNIRVVVFPRDEIVGCLECESTSWRFTESADREGHQWKKMLNLSPQEIEALPCEYFERCPCGVDEQAPKSPGKRKALKEILDLFKIRLPNLVWE